ncbi:MAG: hypothetical protein R2882_09280 [Gemmatimonadales bacterium]
MVVPLKSVWWHETQVVGLPVHPSPWQAWQLAASDAPVSGKDVVA